MLNYSNKNVHIETLKNGTIYHWLRLMFVLTEINGKTPIDLNGSRVGPKLQDWKLSLMAVFIVQEIHYSGQSFLISGDEFFF